MDSLIEWALIGAFVYGIVSDAKRNECSDLEAADRRMAAELDRATAAGRSGGTEAMARVFSSRELDQTGSALVSEFTRCHGSANLLKASGDHLVRGVNARDPDLLEQEAARLRAMGLPHTASAVERMAALIASGAV